MDAVRGGALHDSQGSERHAAPGLPPERSKRVTSRTITIGGAGILGLWQALVLAEAGHRVRLLDRAPTPLAGSASRFGGAMLAPDCEAEAAPAIVRDLGRLSLARWRGVHPAVVRRGSLVVAAPRDRSELARFARLTEKHRSLDAEAIAALEPALGARFPAGLHFAEEAHMAATDALASLLARVRAAGAEVAFSTAMPERPGAGEILVDCRGLAAREELPSLRGVRGERLLVRAPDAGLTRPVRLLHPRHPIYVVPWPDDRYVIGATVIESEEGGAASLRSALELMGTAYALHPAFGEAEILDIGAGVRPAFPDNVPRIVVRDGGSRILVNGAYRHGFLLAPILADAVAGIVADAARSMSHPLVAA